MIKKSEKQESGDVEYIVQKWTRSVDILKGDSWEVHIFDLSEFNDGHWEHVEHVFMRDDGDNAGTGKDIVSNPVELKEELPKLLEDPWQKHFVYIGPNKLVRMQERRNGSWTEIEVIESKDM